MKIAIFGSTGLLGSNLIREYKKKGFDVKGFSRNTSLNVNIEDNNLIDFNNMSIEITKKFNHWIPDIIINTIAIVNLQQCEENYNLAYQTNVKIAQNLARIAKNYKSYFIHISTDHYYNDLKILHCETDDVVLLNNYAKTKYESEKKVLSENNKSLMIRTNIVGFRKNNNDSFFEWLLNSIKDNQKIMLFSDYYTSPICVNKLGELLVKCYNKGLLGVYNIASSEVIDKFSFGIKIAKKFGLSIENVNKVKTIHDKESHLARGLTLGLDISKIEDALCLKMPTVDESVNSLYEEYRSDNE